VTVILMLDLPPLLRDLMCRTLDAQPDMTTISEGSCDRPDAVIVGLEDGDLPPAAQRLLDERARLRILAIGIGDGEAVLYRLRPQRSELGAVTVEELPAVLRGAAG
jgi:hypothetical protein